jgi:hypothetical protein
LRARGYEDEANKVMIEKNEEYGRKLPWWSSSGMWYKLFGKLIGYGYATWNAFWISIGFIIAGWILFWLGHRNNLMEATDEHAYVKTRHNASDVIDTYPKFAAFIYSLENFVPLVKLAMGDYWLPNANAGKDHKLWKIKWRNGRLLRWYLWFHILAGWVLTTLWVAGLTGLVKT